MGQVSLEDSNIANLGSDMDKKARLDAANTEEAWKGAGQKPELKVWRIEQFKVVPITKEDYGKFYSGDSYIVLNSYKVADKDALLHDIHFWLGAETSQDESGTAAYKTVELDDYLGTVPVQHRQVQGHETDLFLSYFKPFTVLTGGVASGFNQVKQGQHINRLLQVNFNKKAGGLVIREVPITFKSLNAGDVFIYDGGEQIIQWNGSEANGMEKVKAAEYVRRLDDSRKGASTVLVVDQGDKDCHKFYKAIGGEGPISPAVEVAVAEVKSRLYRLSDATGSIVFKLEVEGSIKKSLLDSGDVFIVDIGPQVYVWVGKGASKEERRHAMEYAVKYLAMHAKGANTPIVRLTEGNESEDFLKQLA